MVSPQIEQAAASQRTEAGARAERAKARKAAKIANALYHAIIPAISYDGKGLK